MAEHSVATSSRRQLLDHTEHEVQGDQVIVVERGAVARHDDASGRPVDYEPFAVFEGERPDGAHDVAEAWLPLHLIRADPMQPRIQEAPRVLDAPGPRAHGRKGQTASPDFGGETAVLDRGVADRTQTRAPRVVLQLMRAEPSCAGAQTIVFPTVGDVRVCSCVLPWRAARSTWPDEGADLASITRIAIGRLRDGLTQQFITTARVEFGRLLCE